MIRQRTGLTRRSAMLAGSGAVAAPFIMRSPQRAHAEAASRDEERPMHYRFARGDFEVTMLRDGARIMDGPHPIFGADQDPQEVADHVERHFLPSDRMENGFAPVLVNTGRELVLFDTGNAEGGQPDVGNTPERLRQAGYEPEQVDLVVITHCHPDHIGGLMRGTAPTFPNARYALGRVEYEWWTSDAPIGTPRENQVELIESDVVPLAENMTFLEDGEEVVAGISAIAAFGHSPGHMAFHVESNGERFLIFADTTNHYIASLQRPEWHVAFDQDKEMAVESRRRILDMLAAERIPAAGYHMPFPAVGFVERTGESYRWVPASYQLHI